MNGRSDILLVYVSDSQKVLIKLYAKKLGYKSQSQFILAAVEDKIEALMGKDVSVNLERFLVDLNSNSELLLAKVNTVLAQQKLIFKRQQFLGDTYEEWLERIEKLDKEDY